MKQTYYKLLDHYEFDVSNLFIETEDKQKIQEYAANKYGGKLTKCAIKQQINNSDNK